jgi:hypothetical protein
MKLPVVLLVLLAATSLCAQTTTGEPPQVGSETYGLAVQSDAEFKNVLLLGVTGGVSYNTAGYTITDSAVTPATTTVEGDTRLFIAPYVALQDTQQTMSFFVQYAPGVSFDVQHTSNTLSTQDLSGEWVWVPTQKWQIRVREDLNITDNPFAQVGTGGILPGAGGYGGPVGGAFLPSTKRTMTITTANISRKLTEHDYVGIGGSFQLFDYGVLPGGVLSELVNSHTFSGSAYYSHEFSTQWAAGVQGSVFNIYSESATSPSVLEGRTNSYNLLLFAQWKATPHSVLTLFAGPNYVQDSTYVLYPANIIPSSPLYANFWKPTGGMTYGWTGERNAVEAQYIQRITDGGGVLTATSAYAAQLALRRKFTQRLSGDVRGSFTDQKSVAIGDPQYFSSTWFGAGATYEFLRNFTGRFDYGFIRQTGTVLTTAVGNQNVFQISLNYHYSRPI